MLRKIGFDITIFQLQLGMFVQQKIDGSDDKQPFQLVLENAVAVAESTFFFREDVLFSCFKMDGFALQETVFQLHAIRTDVLHRCCPDFAWDVGEVFQAIPIPIHRKPHEIRPILACLGADDDFVLVLAKNFYTFCINMDDKTVKNILLKEDIVAATENQVLLMLEHVGANQVFKLLNVIDFNEIFRYGVEAETVVRFEVDVGFHGGKNTQYKRNFNV